MRGYLTGLLINIVAVFAANCAFAQSISLDGTLSPAGASLGSGSEYIIPQSVGQTVGNNLFHSFSSFNLNTGETATFISDVNIRNILARVTGGSASNIDGLIRSNGTANLFLINPKGIVFGRNARLNIGGSFVGTTANAIGFGDRGNFSASTLDAPSSLLTVNPSALLFNQIPIAPIQNKSIALAGLDPSATFIARGLRVPDGQSLLLVGGDISIDGGRLLAFGGRVELGGASGAGTVGLNGNGSNLSLSFPNGVERSDVSLTNDAGLAVTAGDGGSIAINARNLYMSEGSFLIAGIGAGLGAIGSQAGNIEINTTGTVNLKDGSLIFNALLPGAIGEGGDISITTETLDASDGAQMMTRTDSQGNAGSVIINASNNVSFNGSLTGAISYVSPTSKGQSGGIHISTGSLSVENGAQLLSTIYGEGNAGSVIIDANDTVSFNGSDDLGFVSGIFNDVNETGKGRGGDIRITAGALSLTNGAELSSSVYGTGEAGDVIIDSRNSVTFDGVSRNQRFASGVFSNVQSTGVGRGGEVRITTGSLSVTNNAEIDIGTFGRGDGGSVIINARDHVSFDLGNVYSNVEQGAIGQGGDIRISAGSILFTNGAELQTSTDGEGNAGDVTIAARDRISFDGVGSTVFESGIFPSGIFSEVEETGEGKGGDIFINTKSLSLTNGAQLVAVTRGQGDAGRFIIDTRNAVVLKGIGINGFPSGLFTNTVSGATGQGGEITVNTASFHIADGAVVDAQTSNSRNGGSVTIKANNFDATNGGRVITTTFSSGRSGNITLDIADSLTLSGSNRTFTSHPAQFSRNIFNNKGFASGLFANTALDSTGQGGNLTIHTGQLRVQDGASVTVSSPRSQAGNLNITAKTIGLDQGNLTAETAINRGEEGANINIKVLDLLLLQNNSRISAQANRIANGGNITINANKGFVVAVPRQDSDIIASASEGRGGNIQITTQAIFGIAEGRAIPGNGTNEIDASSQFGIAGTVTLNTPNAEPSRGLVQLPTNLVDASGLISTACTPGNRQSASSFVATGRGGLPLSPTEPLQDATTLAQWVRLKTENASLRSPEVEQPTEIATASTVAPAATVVEASSWVVDPNRNILLIAQTPNTTPHNSWRSPTSCTANQ